MTQRKMLTEKQTSGIVNHLITFQTLVEFQTKAIEIARLLLDDEMETRESIAHHVLMLASEIGDEADHRNQQMIKEILPQLES